MPRPRHWFWSAIAQSWPIYGEALVASLLINLFALVTPFFTMNVYDRVVPNLALETLWVLTIGVALVFGFDLLMRTLRAYFIDVAGKRVDVILSANIFAKVLGHPHGRRARRRSARSRTTCRSSSRSGSS